MEFLKSLPWPQIIAAGIPLVLALLGWSGKFKYIAILKAVIDGVDRASNLNIPVSGKPEESVKKVIAESATMAGVEDKLHDLVKKLTEREKK